MFTLHGLLVTDAMYGSDNAKRTGNVSKVYVRTYPFNLFTIPLYKYVWTAEYTYNIGTAHSTAYACT